jgi:hypothetical protein
MCSRNSSIETIHVHLTNVNRSSGLKGFNNFRRVMQLIGSKPSLTRAALYVPRNGFRFFFESVMIYMRQIIKLEIEADQSSDDDVRAIMEGLERHPSLQNLTLDLPQASYPVLYILPTIQNLTLSGWFGAVAPPATRAIAQLLRTNLPLLCVTLRDINGSPAELCDAITAAQVKGVEFCNYASPEIATATTSSAADLPSATLTSLQSSLKTFDLVVNVYHNLATEILTNFGVRLPSMPTLERLNVNLRTGPPSRLNVSVPGDLAEAYATMVRSAALRLKLKSFRIVLPVYLPSIDIAWQLVSGLVLS